ncbi:MAG: polysaccharide deacetylase family protein [Anaerolineaceae bacterium]|nr:polysaccharide deacetylase family protein [Anaerolineaceae bacterium]
MKKKAIFTSSWDDGHVLDMKMADLLSQYHLTGTFYIPHHLQNKKRISNNEIINLSKNFEIGAHTYSHQVLSKTNLQNCIYEIQKGKSFLENIIGKPITSFCFPEGKFKKHHIKIVNELGFKCIRTVELFNMNYPISHNGIYVMGTTLQVFPHNFISYSKNILKRNNYRYIPIILSLYNKNWLQIAKHLFLETLKNHGVFHIWGHSWEIKEIDYWNQLEDFFSFLSGYREDFIPYTNTEVCLHAFTRDN